MTRKFKYQLNHFVSIQPREISIDSLANKLLKDHKIPPHVFDQDRRIPDGESREIPEERLKVYAQLLGVSVKSLVEELQEEYVLK